MPTLDKVTLRISLPSELLQQYEAQAAITGQDVEEVILARLTEHVNHSSYTGRHLSIAPEQRQELEKALGKSIRTSFELVHSIRSALSVRINDLSIPIAPELLRRLQTRAIRIPFPPPPPWHRAA